MNETKRDLNALLDFIDLAARSGFVNEKTAINRKNTAKLILTSVPNVDMSDVTKIDIDDVFQRYVILSGSKTPPATLQGQKSHLKSALREFSSYVADPVHYRSTSKIRKSRVTKTTVTMDGKIAPTAPAQAENAAKPSAIPETIVQGPSTSPTIHIDFQIHIAPDTDPTLVDKIFESLSRHFPNK